MSAELETLDQLLGGDMPLQIIRGVYPDDKTFAIGIHALLRNGDVRLFFQGTEVPQWRWRALFEAGEVTFEIAKFKLALTSQGARRIS